MENIHLEGYGKSEVHRVVHISSACCNSFYSVQAPVHGKRQPSRRDSEGSKAASGQ